MQKKFLSEYNRIMEEVVTFLASENKLTHGEKSAFGTTGSRVETGSSSFGTTGSAFGTTSSRVETGSSSFGTTGPTLFANSNTPDNIATEDAGMTTAGVMGPTDTSQSLANTATKCTGQNVPHEDAGLTTADLKPIYCPAIPYNKKRRKNILFKRTIK